MTKPTLIIDSNCISWMAKQSMRKAGLDNKGTGIIYGFLRTTLSLANQFQTDKLIFAWDSKESHRIDFWHDYKLRRRLEKKKDVPAIRQNYTIRKIVLPQMGFKNIFIQAGFEGDDVIAKVVKTCGLERMIVVTEDNDMYQLLDKCMIYFPRRKHFMTRKDLKKKYNVGPENWNLFKSLVGCHSDDVKGVMGIGPKTAAKLINKGTILEEHREIIDRNLQLVSLPCPLKPINKIVINIKEVFKKKDFIDICNKYNFRSLIKDKERWFRILNMT